jgi:hypothetical protein
MTVKVALLAASVLALLLPFAAAAFVTPRHTVDCGMSEGEGPASIACSRPRNGFLVWMRERGRVHASVDARLRGYWKRGSFVLGFGETFRLAGFRCVSRVTGLTCTNRDGHGWWLGREKGYRAF